MGDEEDAKKEVLECLDRIVEKVIDEATDSLAFDTETTGFNGSVIQLGYVRINSDGQEIDSSCRYLKLIPGEAIHPKAKEVHNITETILEVKGEDPVVVINDFARVASATVARGGRIVAHNAKFDCARLAYTAELLNITPPVLEEHTFCTCANGYMHAEFFTSNGRRKRPRNDELYNHLFGTTPREILHDALNDARVTIASYIEGRKRGWW